MGIIGDLLTLPVLGAPRLTAWLGSKLCEEIDRESLDEGRVRGELLELQERYELGEIDEEEYDRRESALLAQLIEIREAVARRDRRA